MAEEKKKTTKKKKKSSGGLIAVLIIIVVLLILIVGVAVFWSGAFGGTKKEIYGIGEPAKKNGVQVTLTGYQETYGSEWNASSTGNVYMLVEFEIENASKEDVAVSSLLSFTAYADGVESTLSIGALLENNQAQLDGTVASGKHMKGCVGYEVPYDWKEFEIHFNSDVWRDNKFKFVIQKSKDESTTLVEEQQTQDEEAIEYHIGESWVVDGQWSLTVNSVEETADRNEYSEKAPAVVYLVTYTYQNIGYVDQNGLMDGLYIDMEDTIVDSAGQMGYSYPADKTLHPQETPVGATCQAQACIGVDNPGSFKIRVTKYDGNGDKQSAVFSVDF